MCVLESHRLWRICTYHGVYWVSEFRFNMTDCVIASSIFDCAISAMHNAPLETELLYFWIFNLVFYFNFISICPFHLVWFSLVFTLWLLVLFYFNFVSVTNWILNYVCKTNPGSFLKNFFFFQLHFHLSVNTKVFILFSFYCTLIIITLHRLKWGS